MGVKLSIIVPIYNVEQYLAKCIDSLLNQDLSTSEYEILLVDDGSTDNSGQIADSFLENHQNIIVLHQNNQGLSGARNTGIRNARGEYIQFVDSDDNLEPNVLKTLIEKMDADNLDVLRFDYQNVNERGEVFLPYRNEKAFVDFSEDICSGPVFLAERLGYSCYACQFMIKTKLLIKEQLFFKEGILFEDVEWTPRVLQRAIRVSSSNLIVYDYLYRKGSISRADNLKQQKKVVDSKINIIKELKEQSVRFHDNKWYFCMIAFVALSAISMIAMSLYSERRGYLYRIKELDIIPLSLFDMTPRNANKIRLINFSPTIYCFLFHLKSKI